MATLIAILYTSLIFRGFTAVFTQSMFIIANKPAYALALPVSLKNPATGAARAINGVDSSR
jgi:hypothetical protein